MNKLEVGIYVRTKWGYICELININDFREPSMKYGVEANYLKDVMFIGDEDILKASHNIIDLIEVGDYVNGKEIEQIINNELYFETSDMASKISFKEKDIKSIVTKEQMEQMAYKVGK